MYPSTRRNYTDEFKAQAIALAPSIDRRKTGKGTMKKGTDLSPENKSEAGFPTSWRWRSKVSINAGV